MKPLLGCLAVVLCLFLILPAHAQLPVAGAVYHFDATAVDTLNPNEVRTDGPDTFVHTWLDQTGNLDSAGPDDFVSNIEEAQHPLYVPNARVTTGSNPVDLPALRFSGDDRLLSAVDVAGLNGVAGATVFVVALQPDQAANGTSHSFGTAGGGTNRSLSFQQEPSGNDVRMNYRATGASPQWRFNVNPVTGTDWTARTLVFDGAGATDVDRLKTYLNTSNIPDAGGVFSGAGVAATLTNPGTVVVGALDPSGVSSWVGDIGEIIAYPTALSAPDLSAVHVYLANKWDFEVPPDPTEATLYEWSVDSSGDWNVGGNWNILDGTFGNAPDAAEQTAILGSAIASTRTVFTDSALTINSVQFDNANSYVVAGGGSVNLAQTQTGTLPNISVLLGTHEFQARVNLGDDTTVITATDATIEFNNRLDLAGHTLTKTGDGTMAANNNVLTGGGMVDCQEGTCGGTGTIFGSLNNDATVAPGNSPGILTVDGNYTQGASGTLALEIGGLVPGEEHDKLVVTGTATLAGTLDVSLINGFTLAGDMEFDVLDFNSVVNDFSTFNLPSGLVWDVSDGTLCFGNCVGGSLTDYDNDGSWGLGDLNLVLFNWNEDGASLPPAWLNSRPGAGTSVGLPELNQVLFNWGQPGSLAAVPEPMSGILLLTGLLALVAGRRRR
jgi:hypothetical protein